MRVPVKIPVAGKLVSISYPITVPGDAEDADVYGDTTQDGLEIRISKSKNKTSRQVFETLYHEIKHSAITITGVAHMLGDKLEETLVTGVENAVADLFCFNPDAKGVKWKEVKFPFEDD